MNKTFGHAFWYHQKRNSMVFWEKVFIPTCPTRQTVFMVCRRKSYQSDIKTFCYFGVTISISITVHLCTMTQRKWNVNNITKNWTFFSSGLVGVTHYSQIVLNIRNNLGFRLQKKLNSTYLLYFGGFFVGFVTMKCSVFSNIFSTGALTLLHYWW